MQEWHPRGPEFETPGLHRLKYTCKGHRKNLVHFIHPSIHPFSLFLFTIASGLCCCCCCNYVRNVMCSTPSGKGKFVAGCNKHTIFVEPIKQSHKREQSCNEFCWRSRLALVNKVRFCSVYSW